MNGYPEHSDETLFAYIDGELSADDAAAFEREIMRSPELRSRLESLEQIHEGLMRIADPSNAPRRESVPSAKGVGGLVVWGALAASILVVGAMIVQLSSPRAPSFTPKKYVEKLVNAGEDYARITHAFEPHIVCDTPEKFARYTIDALGEEIHADFNAGTTLVGWRAYGSSYDPDERAPSRRVLLAVSPEGSQAIVYFIPEGLEGPELTVGDHLRVHERALGGVRVIEITPDEVPGVIGVLRMP